MERWRRGESSGFKDSYKGEQRWRRLAARDHARTRQKLEQQNARLQAANVKAATHLLSGGMNELLPGRRKYAAGTRFTRSGKMVGGGVLVPPWALLQLKDERSASIVAAIEDWGQKAAPLKKAIRNLIIPIIVEFAGARIRAVLEDPSQANELLSSSGNAVTHEPARKLTQLTRRTRLDVETPLRDTGTMARGLKITANNAGKISVTVPPSRAWALKNMEEGGIITISEKYKVVAKARVAALSQQVRGTASQHGPLGKSANSRAAKQLDAWLTVLKMRTGRRLDVPARPVIKPAFEAAVEDVRNQLPAYLERPIMAILMNNIPPTHKKSAEAFRPTSLGVSVKTSTTKLRDAAGNIQKGKYGKHLTKTTYRATASFEYGAGFGS